MADSLGDFLRGSAPDDETSFNILKEDMPKWRPGGEFYKAELGDAYSIGDVEEREVLDFRSPEGETRKLLFGLNEWPSFSYNLPAVNLRGGGSTKKEDKEERPKPVRKVFVAFKVKRVSDISNLEEHFKIKFHLYFNWLPTYEEYQDYLRAIEDDRVSDWKPKWHPHLEYLNQIEKIKEKWEFYPEEGTFRMKKLHDFMTKCCDDPMVYDPIAFEEDGQRISLGTWSDDRAYFIRGKLEIELMLSEELELQSFPFDCQDLSVVMREETRDVRIVFVPEMRKLAFGSIDPRFSVICEWDMESARIEFGSSNPKSSRAGSKYPTMILRFKMQRRWQVFMWNIVLMMMLIEFLTLTAFALNIEDGEAADRMGLCMIMVLTAIAFLQIVKSRLPMLPYLTILDWYIYSSYLFLVGVMVETSALHSLYQNSQEKGGDFNANEKDEILLWFGLWYLVVYHLAFGIAAVFIRKKEKAKLVMNSDQIDAEVAQTRPVLQFDNRKGMRTGNKKRLLFFRAMKKPEKKKEDDAEKKNK